MAITSDERPRRASAPEPGRDDSIDGAQLESLRSDAESRSPHTSPSHVALLEQSRAVEIAAMGRDRDAVHLELCRLRAEMCEHIRDEADAVEALPTFKRTVVSGGQRDLLDQIDQLLESSADGDPSAWLWRTVSIIHGLVRQARLEANIEAEAARRADQRGPSRCGG